MSSPLIVSVVVRSAELGEHRWPAFPLEPGTRFDLEYADEAGEPAPFALEYTEGNHVTVYVWAE